MKHFIHKT